jgi:Flp pilus assembly protein TadG
MTVPGFRDEGSMTVELVLLTPTVFLIALAVLAFGRVSESDQLVVEASRAGAEAAAVQPDAASAESGAAESAVVGIFDRVHTCARASVSTDTSHFYPGGYVRVTVSCQLNLFDLAVPGLPSTKTVQASATAPIDPYRSVS